MVIWFLFNLLYRDLEGVSWLCDESDASRRQIFGGFEMQEASNQAGIESIFEIYERDWWKAISGG
jgi:hypothetical protein